MADATYFDMAPEQLLGVQGLATMAGAPSHIFIRTPQHKGHPHPVLSRSTSEAPLRAFSPWSFPPTELEARLRPALRKFSLDGAPCQWHSAPTITPLGVFSTDIPFSPSCTG